MTYIFTEADRLRNQGQSLEASKKYQEISESSDDPQIIGAALHMSAVCLNQAGDHLSAEEYFLKAEEHYIDLNDKFNLARVQRDHGNCLLAQGKVEDAKEALSASIESFRDTDSPDVLGELAMSQSKLAAALAKSEQGSEAENLAYQAISNANKSENTFYVATAYKEAGRVCFLNRKYEAMLNCLYAALGALKQVEDSQDRMHAELYLAICFAYGKLKNTKLSDAYNLKAQEHLKQLDQESADRIRGYFN